MPLTHGHSYLVKPSKAEKDQPPIGGLQLEYSGKLFEMLSKVFDNAHLECEIEISFRPDENGQQNNRCRSSLQTYLKRPDLRTGRKIAEQLQAVTTHRSGLGLLFLLAGSDSKGSRLVVARFPADEGVVARETRTTLTLEFFERVFMKNAFSYKSVLYRAPTNTAGFWDGLAVDRQLNEGAISEYWIGDFLLSQYRTNGPAGTRRLAIAVKQAVRGASDADVKNELWAAAKLMRGQGGTTTSAAKIMQSLGLSPEAKELVARAMPRAELLTETFKFDLAEYDSNIAYRAVELDNGGIMVAENEEFEKVFRSEKLRGSDDQYRFTTEGKIVNQQTRRKA